MKAAAKNAVALLVATAGAAALGLYAWFGVAQPDERKAEQKAVDEKLVAAWPAGHRLEDGGTPPPPIFTRISISTGGETSQLERRGEEWFLTAPVQAKADSSVVSALVRQLETGSVKEALEPNPTAEDLARYGLDTPKFTVKATAHTGDATAAREYVVEGGIENPFDGSVFLRKNGEPTVFSAPGSLRGALQKSAFELRDKLVLSLPVEQIATLEVKHPQGGYKLSQENGAWRVTAPVAYAADKDLVSGMLSSLGSERAIAFPEETDALKKAFERPALDATVELRSNERIRLRFAEVKDEGVHVLREQEGSAPVLARMNAGARSHLEKTPQALRDKKVLAFDRDAVARVVIHPASGAPLELVKEPTDAGVSDAWRLTQPEAGPALAWKVSSLLWSLGALKGIDLVEENARRLERFGLQKPNRRVELFDASGTALASLAIGGEVKGASDRLYVLNDRGTAFDVEKSRLSDLPASAAELLEKKPSDGGVDAGVASSTPE